MDITIEYIFHSSVFKALGDIFRIFFAKYFNYSSMPLFLLFFPVIVLTAPFWHDRGSGCYFIPEFSLLWRNFTFLCQIQKFSIIFKWFDDWVSTDAEGIWMSQSEFCLVIPRVEQRNSETIDWKLSCIHWRILLIYWYWIYSIWYSGMNSQTTKASVSPCIDVLNSNGFMINRIDIFARIEMISLIGSNYRDSSFLWLNGIQSSFGRLRCPSIRYHRDFQ